MLWVFLVPSLDANQDRDSQHLNVCKWDCNRLINSHDLAPLGSLRKHDPCEEY